MSDSLKIVYDDEPSDRRGPPVSLLIAAGCAVVAAWLLLGSIEAPTDIPAELTTPPPLAIAVMPDLRGSSLIGAGNKLRDAGLDRGAVERARWIADPEVAVGTVSAQTPEPGSEVFDFDEVDLVLSSGGPTITWDEVPLTMRDLLNGVATPDVDEPILVLDTEAGNAYKVDALLFGGCRAVDLTKDSLYDTTFEKFCPPPTIAPIVGWMGDGAMYAIDGLPQQDYLDVGSAISLGPDQPFGRQLWSISPHRRAPQVEVDDRTVRVVGGFYSFVLKVPEDSMLSPEEVGGLIAPSDIRGNLVVDLTPPLSFYSKSGIAGSNAPAGQSARRHRQVPGEPFSARSTVNIVSTRDEIGVVVDKRYSDQVEVLSVPPTRWSSQSIGGWQFAYPTNWIAHDPNTDRSSIMAVATYGGSDDIEPCAGFPVAGIRNMGAQDIVLSVSVGETRAARKWPAHFDEGNLGQIVSDYGSSCLKDVDAEIRVDTLLYNGVSLELMSAFGPEVDEAARNQALAILTSLESIPDYLER